MNPSNIKYGVAFGSDQHLVFGPFRNREVADWYGRNECADESYRIVPV